MISIMKRFNGSRIKSARLYNGLTVEELSNKLGVSKQAVSQYENDIIDPPIEKMFLLSSALNFHLITFLKRLNQVLQLEQHILELCYVQIPNLVHNKNPG